MTAMTPDGPPSVRGAKPVRVRKPTVGRQPGAGAPDKTARPVLVTGAAGFIGRRLVARLLAEGALVRAFDLGECPAALAGSTNLTWLRGDIRDAAVVAASLKDCETAFHLAALVGDWGAKAAHEAVTVGGTRNLFQAVREQGATTRVVLASSIVVYGHRLSAERCHEGLPHGRPCGPYSASKQAQEVLAAGFVQQGVDVRIVRPANVYGAGSKPWVDDLGAELKKGTPSLIGGGDYDAGLVHVDHVVDVLLRAAGKAGARGQIYNAADEEGVTWRQYMTDLAALHGAPSPRSVPRPLAQVLAAAGESTWRLLNLASRPPLTREALNLVGSRHRIDMSKTRRELGFMPLKTYRDGLQEIRIYLSA